MESLATVLRRIPIFAGLPPGSFAKIIADLREERHPPGRVICYEGDAAHDFYIIKSGEVEVLINRTGNQRELVALSGPHEWFGERALFSDRPRSATVVTRTEVELWRLTKEKFDALIEENPWLILHFTQVLSDRLYRGNQELSKVQAAFNQQMQALFAAQPVARRTFLTRTAVLATLDAEIARSLTGLADPAATMVLLPPEIQPTVSRGLIDTQIEALGRPSRAEIVNGVVLVGAIIGWITAPYHQIDVAWVAMIGLALLLAVDLLDRTTFRSGIYWDFLFYLGAVLGLTGVVRHLGVDDWVIHRLAPVLEPMTAQPARFLMVMAVAVFAARFVLPSFPLVSVLIITVVPIAAPAGIQPLALTLAICTTVAVWFLPYQSTYYLALYFGTKEKAFSHTQVRLLAWSYGAIYLLAIAAAIPFWRDLGLLP